VAVREAISQRIEETRDQLVDPHSDPDRDRILKGMLIAFYDVLEAKPEISIEEKLFNDNDV
jgi:hypothetical protein